MIRTKSTIVMAALWASGCVAEPVEEAWEPLITSAWELTPGTERYECARLTIDRDLRVRHLRAINPPGTHHTVLSAGPPSGPDGISECAPNEANARMIFGSGVGENRIDMPDDVAVVMFAGEQLLLNLHLFNVGATPIVGESGTSVVLVAADEARYDADAALMGTLDITLPPMARTTVHGGCVLDHEATVFGVFPHMHQLGVHMKVTGHTAAGETLLLDSDYEFEDQHSRAVSLPTRPGDEIRVACTYDNTRDETVRFGDSSLDEMCFAAVARYPATGQSLCTSAPGAAADAP